MSSFLLLDLHALATDGELLVGFDGVTGLLTSTDGGTTWTPGAPIAAAALAVTDAGVWATTSDGLQLGTDAGRIFTVLPDAPPLALLSAAQDGSRNCHLVRPHCRTRSVGPMGAEQHRCNQLRRRGIVPRTRADREDPGAYVFAKPPSDNEWHTQLAGQTRLTITAPGDLHTARTAWAHLATHP